MISTDKAISHLLWYRTRDGEDLDSTPEGASFWRNVIKGKTHIFTNKYGLYGKNIPPKIKAEIESEFNCSFRIKEGKKYYSISEASYILEINQSNIRYWCKKFQLNPRRKGNNRLFSQNVINKLGKIKEMSETGWYTIEGIKHFIK